jgi:VWFA-related protein
MRVPGHIGVSLAAAAGLAWAVTVRAPSEAAAILEALLRGTVEQAPAEPPKKPAPRHEEAPLFVSNVRLVNLLVSVSDRAGHPISNLRPEEFEVFEDGVPQKVAVAGSGEVPFNLVLLVDLSGSTIRDRPAMKEAARRFVAVTRPQDRIALYVLADGQFQVLSTLTADRKRLGELIEQIPDLRGGTPLYAAMVLAYAEELAARPQERNALVVISDGMDDGLVTQKAACVPFDRLRRAAAVMPALIYPIHLDSRNIFYGARALRQMRQLAEASGGRLFPAQSIQDLDPVYEQVAGELRSVHTLAYYPANQKFDGRWRRIQVRVKRAGAQVRTRAGYYAR